MKKTAIAVLASALFASSAIADPAPKKVTIIKPPEPVRYMVRNAWHIVPTILLAPTSLIIQALSNRSSGNRFTDEFARQTPALSDALMNALEKEFSALGYEVARNTQIYVSPANPYQVNHSAFQSSDSLNVYAYFEEVGLYSGWSSSFYEPAVTISACVDMQKDKSCAINLFAAYGYGYVDDGSTYFTARPIDRWFSTDEVSLRGDDVKTAMHYGIAQMARGIARQVKMQAEQKIDH